MVCRYISEDKHVHYFRKCIFMDHHEKTIKYTDTLLTHKEIHLDIPLNHEKYDISHCSVTFGKLVQCTYSLQVTLEFGSILSEEPDFQMPVHITEIENEIMG